MRMVDFRCDACGADFEALVRLSEEPACRQCGSVTLIRLWRAAPQMRPDSIPGGYWAHHGLCHEDGTPRRYDSRSEIKLECEKRGLIPWTEIHTEDKTKDARVRADWYQSAEAKQQKAERDEMRRAGVRPTAPRRSSPRRQGDPVRREQIRQIARQVLG